MAKVKKEGVITVEEAKGTETTVEIVEGMQFDRGYISVLRHQRRQDGDRARPSAHPDLRQEDQRHEELLPVLEKQVQTGNPLLIIAES